MPETTQSQKDKVMALQAALTAFKMAVNNAQSAADDVWLIAAALHTADGAKAANACTKLAGALDIARGTVRSAHAEASDALVAFDPAYGAVVVQGGGGGRR